MRELVWVFVGGGLGSICRYAITIILKETNSLYPWPTLLANAIGSLLIGVLADQLMRSTSVQSANTLFWIIGFCGGLTTFSAFALENLTLFRTSSGSFFTYLCQPDLFCLPWHGCARHFFVKADFLKISPFYCFIPILCMGC